MNKLMVLTDRYGDKQYVFNDGCSTDAESVINYLAQPHQELVEVREIYDYEVIPKFIKLHPDLDRCESMDIVENMLGHIVNGSSDECFDENFLPSFNEIWDLSEE